MISMREELAGAHQALRHPSRELIRPTGAMLLVPYVLFDIIRTTVRLICGLYLEQ